MALDFSNINFNPVAFDPNVNLAPGAVDFASSLSERVTQSQSSAGNVSPTYKNMSQIKEKLLRPALTSHYQCWFNPPTDVLNWIRDNRGFNYNSAINQELISLSCSEASLPGSAIMTNEINDDHTGVTERHAYRRQYDDRSDFTFYVDYGRTEGNYNVLWFFEQWMQYIVDEQFVNGLDDNKYFYRVNFPKSYQSNALYLNKFERDVSQNGSYLEYRFIQAYPINISSMPVSYDSSQLLKCTVSFTYSRYVVRRRRLNQIDSVNQEPQRPQIPGIPSPPPPEESMSRMPEGAVYNDFLNGNRQINGRAIGNPALDQFGVRDPFGRGAPGTEGANILA